MNKTLTLISGLGVGAGLMYMFDPDRGDRRRALVRDKVVHTWHETENAVTTAAQDLNNRARGIVTEVRSRLRGEDVSDEVLEERVRAELGRYISHTSPIQVTAHQGRVTLRGQVLDSEVDDLLSCVAMVRGVTGVENRLEVRERPDDISSLQSGETRTGPRFAWLQKNWSPAARMVAGATGGALAVYGGWRRDAIGATLGTVGLGMVARGLTNSELPTLVGLDQSNGSNEETR